MYPTCIRWLVLLACAMVAPLADASEVALIDESPTQDVALGAADQLGSTLLLVNHCDGSCGGCDCGCYETKWKSVTTCEACWQPLYLCCNLTDAWCEPFAGSPNGSSGAPRQGWLATPDGFFTKEFHTFYGRLNNLNGSTDVDTALFQFQYPLTRRIWVGLDVPYSDYGDDRGFDDTVITGKLLLHETQNFGLTGELGVRAPTGDEELGGGVTALIPAVNTWSDIGGGWSFRSGVGAAVGTGGVPNNTSDTDMLYTVALGQTITPHDATPFGDFTYYAAINGRSQLDGPDQHTFLYITPGMRTHLFCNLFFLTAVQIPVSGPDSYDSNLMFMFVKGI